MMHKIVNVFIFALVAIHECKGQNNTGTEDSAQTNTVTDEETALQRGMDPIFDLYHNFLDTVMSQSFYDANTPFNVQTLIDITKDGNYDQLQSNWQDLVKTFGGYAGCIIVGLLFVVFMPIVGLIYCCCHCCCHKCGGTREMMDPKHASCKRWTYTVILLICATLMLAGGIITFLGSELLHKSLKNEDNSGLVGKLDDSLGHLQKFTNDTLHDIVNIAREDIINKGLGKILPEIKDAADRTVNKVKKTINAEQLLDEASKLGNVATTVLGDLKNLKLQVEKLQHLQTNVSDKLNGVKSDINKACTGTICGDVKNKVDALNLDANYTQLKDQQDKIDQVAKAVNISTFVKQASDEFDKVSAEVNSTVHNQISDAEQQVNDMNVTISTQISNISSKAKPFTDSVSEGQNFANKEQETFKDIADYIWYACIGMGCAVILVVFFYYMGVLFGLCGERPGPRAACCNRETGAHLLCTGICCSFLFAWILMLVVILMFTLGGLSYSMACKYIRNGVENVDEFESVLSDGFNWNISDSFGVQNLTIARMFQNCKDDMGIYSALHLQYIFDIDKEFDLSDVEKQVKEMENTTLKIPNITLLSSDLKTQLDEYKTAAVSDIDFTEYTIELDKPLFGGEQLQVVINDIKSAAAAANTTGQQTLADSLTEAAADLEKLKTEEIAEINVEKGKLSDSLKNLQGNVNKSVPASIDNLTSSINESEYNFNTDKDTIVKDELTAAVNEILKIIEDTVNSTKLKIKNDVGKCRPLYDAAQSVVDAVCVVTLDPLNAIWFGLGWSLFFYIPCFIFAALLANLYKRTEKYRKKESGFDDPIHSHNGEYDGYRGNGHEDNVPLTSMGKEQRYSSNGAYNQGYQGREYAHEPRYHRDEASGYPPDNYSRDRGVPRGSAGHVYARPHADPYDQPPHYDDAVSDRYDRVSRHGRMSGDRAGY